MLLAVLVTALNACKPLHIDDPAYSFVAHQVAERPLDPYGFGSFWWNHPQPANQVLAPPVLPYWWSLSIRLLGENPVIWKIWLFPIILLFIFTLHALYRRFAAGHETALVWMTALSPVFLPSCNLMLDIPVLAISLAALLMFLRAADSCSIALAALSGLVAGVGMETKYTGFLIPAAMLLHALMFRRLGLWCVAAVVAAQVFLGWEFFTALLYGESHFLFAVRAGDSTLEEKLQIVPSMVVMAGGTIGPIMLLGLGALRAPRWRLWLGTGLILASLALAQFLGEELRLLWSAQSLCQRMTDWIEEPLEVEHVTFGLLGLIATVVGIAVVGRLLRTAPNDSFRKVDAFLILWLLLEIAGMIALSPFPAVRRLMGVAIVAMVLAGRLFARMEIVSPSRRLLPGLAALSALLGLGYALLDLREAWVLQDAAGVGAALVEKQKPARVWFVGHWGLQFYGERGGVREVVPLYDPPEPIDRRDSIMLPGRSRLRKGDLLLWPDNGIHCQAIDIPPAATKQLITMQWDDPIQLQTVISFWAGSCPLRHRTGPRRLLHVSRVLKDFDG